MSVSGNINEVLKQIQLLIKLYGNASFVDLQRHVATLSKTDTLSS